jgi:hypothetical protein
VRPASRISPAEPVQHAIILKFDCKLILDSTCAKRQTRYHCAELIRENHRGCADGHGRARNKFVGIPPPATRGLDLTYIEAASSGQVLSPWKTPTASFPDAADVCYNLLNIR